MDHVIFVRFSFIRGGSTLRDRLVSISGTSPDEEFVVVIPDPDSPSFSFGTWIMRPPE